MSGEQTTATEPFEIQDAPEQLAELVLSNFDTSNSEAQPIPEGFRSRYTEILREEGIIVKDAEVIYATRKMSSERTLKFENEGYTKELLHPISKHGEFVRIRVDRGSIRDLTDSWNHEKYIDLKNNCYLSFSEGSVVFLQIRVL